MTEHKKELFKRLEPKEYVTQELISNEEPKFFRDAYRRFKKNKGAHIALFMIIGILFLAAFGPLIGGHVYNEVITQHINLPPRVPFIENLGILNGMRDNVNIYLQKGFNDVYYWFGADGLGRDLWVRVWMGTRIYFLVAFVAVLIDVIIGISYGLISGYYGGKVDMVMQRFVEIISGIPNLVVVILLVLVLKPGLQSIIFALMITGWISMSRVVRSQVLKLKELEFVLAARTLVASSFVIIIKEILPNIIGQIIVMTMFSIPSAIFYESFLAFVGLGLQPPLASLGVLISTGYQSLLIYPHMVIFPVLVLSLLMLSFNLVADWLRDAFDPKMKGF
jgi:oligopeptide transport system permease protein